MNPSADLKGVRVEKLSRAYDAHYGLVDLDAEFPAGSVTMLLGPNGAGKSTLIAILSTLSRQTEGRVFFGERLVGEGDARIRAHIGYVGHSTMLYPTLSARENLTFFGRLYGLKDLDALATEWLETVGLTRDADRPVEEFSRGMAQRLTLARALLPGPQLLLLDEPLTGLDQAGIALAVDLLAKARDEGAIIIMASHDLRSTADLADRALILRRGRKVFEGAFDDDLASVYHRALAGAAR